jgi:Domain of unknown function (DUF4386)
MLSDSRQFFKNVVTFSLFAAPLLLLASALIVPSFEGDEAEQLASIAQAPDRYYVFTLLSFISSVLLVPVLLGLMYMLRHRAPTLGNLGGTLALVGTLVSVGDAISQLFIWQMVAPGADRAQMTALLIRFDDAPGASVIFKIGGPSFVIGMVLLGIGLYRSGVVPTWTAAALPIGAVLNIAGFVIGSSVVVIISCAVLLVSLGWIGGLVLRSSEQAWQGDLAHRQPVSSAATREGLRGASGNA